MGKSSSKFYEITEELVQRVWDEEISCEQACNECPYRKKCYDKKLYFSCGVWEETMGEDL